MGKRAFGRHHLRNSGRPGYGDRSVSYTGKPTDVDNGGLAGGGGDLARVSSEGGCVCVCARARARPMRFWCVCVCVCVCVVCVWRGARGD